MQIETAANERARADAITERHYLTKAIQSLLRGHLGLAWRWQRDAFGNWLVGIGLAEDIFAEFYPQS